MAKVDRKILIAVSVILFLLIAVVIKKSCTAPTDTKPPTSQQVRRALAEPEQKEDFEMIPDDGYRRAPSSRSLAQSHGMDGQKCGITQATHLGYTYQVPEKLPEVEDLMPEESATDAHYDVEAAQTVPYVFTFPLTSALTKTRAEQAGDMWRGDLSIQARDPTHDFKTIWNHGDQLLNGAFSDHTKKAHEMVSCPYTRNSASVVANEELIQDF